MSYAFKVQVLTCISFLSITFTKTQVSIKAKSNATELVTEITSTSTTYLPLDNHAMDVHCKFQANGLKCNSGGRPKTMWYYDTKMQGCKEFTYNRCKSSNKNAFLNYNLCYTQCREDGAHDIFDILPENAACMLQPDFGDCQDYIPMFYFDITLRRCLGFAFSGCGGNQNRFYDTKTCKNVCTDATNELLLNTEDKTEEKQ